MPDAARWQRIKADPAALAKHNARSARGMKKYQGKPEVREGRAEKYFRHRSRRQKEEHRLRTSGVSIITAIDLVQDRNRSTIRQTRYQTEIDRLATEIIEGRKTVTEAREKCDRITAAYAAEKEKAKSWPKNETASGVSSKKPRPKAIPRNSEPSSAT